MKLRDLVNTLKALDLTIFCPTSNGDNRLLYVGDMEKLPWGYAKFTVKSLWINSPSSLGIMLAEQIPEDYLN